MSLVFMERHWTPAFAGVTIARTDSFSAVIPEKVDQPPMYDISTLRTGLASPSVLIVLSSE